MSVIVRGMEMPKNCMSCPFPAVGVDAYYCHCPTQDGKEYDFKYADTIPDTCPLIELPPHGRLGDLDKLNIHDISPVDGFCVMGVTEEDIGLAETVIEAEGET